MVSHVNFYENAKEANIRLQHSVVLYDKEPYYVFCVVDGHADGIFRIYMEPTGHKEGSVLNRIGGCPYDMPAGPEKLVAMDNWMKANSTSGVVRKFANSSLFSKFRPFDLGMVNTGGKVYYTERTPQRHTQQGLIQNMVMSLPVCLEPASRMNGSISIQSSELKDCITGKYPHINDCIDKLLDPDISNDGVAFSREFSLLRGPINTLFLAYKTDVVGFLKNGNATVLKLCKTKAHTIQLIDELGAFGSIQQ